MIHDPKICDFLALIAKEERLNEKILHMTANENILSETVNNAMSTSLSNRYHIGTRTDYHENAIVEREGFIFRGLPDIYRLESLANEALNHNLGGKVSDCRPLSGVHAMICSLASLTEPGDVVLSMHSSGGGHFATANIVRLLGRKSILVDYDPITLTVSLSHLKELKEKYHIKVAFFDDGAPLYAMPFGDIKNILGNDTIIVYDGSHTLGLIFGNTLMNPIKEGCDIVQGNTHKTFPGPHKALLHFADEEMAEKTMKIIGEALVSSQHTHHSIALYISILEMDVYGAQYAAAVVFNAAMLSEELVSHGFKVLNNGKSYTHTHQLLLCLPDGLSAQEAYARLLKCNISTNAKHVYHHEVIRIGVQELTRLGMKTGEMKFIASIIKKALLGDISGLPSLAAQVAELNSSFKQVHYSFDDFNKI